VRYNADMTSDATSSPYEPTVTFLGAAQCVTGSMHLVEFGRARLLLDCGRVVGRRQPMRPAGEFPFEPHSLDAVILSHAHIDHCGNLPQLVRQGFRGPIWCTPATRDLLEIVLPDAARVHEEDAAVAGIVQDRTPEPLYGRSDAQRTIDQCVPVAYGQRFVPAPGCQGVLLDAGHILGSAMVQLEIGRPGRPYLLTFTGDLGRRGLPFVREPSAVPAADLILCESTYGGRLHASPAEMAQTLQRVVRETAARGGRVLIPAFSLGRTQIVVHYLQSWMCAGVLPALPLYVDSPLAEEIAQVHERHRDLLAAGVAEDPPVHYVRTPEERRELPQQTGPCVVVASGGMCEGGRILHHLKHHLDDPRDTIVLVSYQAPSSVGAQLLEHRPTVHFHGRRWNKWAEVIQVNGFSGHADHRDFLALLSPAAAQAGRVCLVHGELAQAEALAKGLRGLGFGEVSVPGRWQQVPVGWHRAG
jgi:metallo-beta-lactamase family protein